MRGFDLATNALVTYESRTWNNATRAATSGAAQSNLFGLAYSGVQSGNYAGLHVLSAGDNTMSRITLPTTPNPAATPHSEVAALTSGPAGVVFDTAQTSAGVTAINDTTLHFPTFAQAISDDPTATSALPGKGNYGITLDNASPAKFTIVSSQLDRIDKATDAASSTVSAFVSGAPLDAPKDITMIGGTFYVANCGGNDIVKVTSAGVMSIVAGDGAARETDGANTGAEFDCPFGITNDGTNLYVTDLSGNTLRKISNLQ